MSSRVACSPALIISGAWLLLFLILNSVSAADEETYSASADASVERAKTAGARLSSPSSSLIARPLSGRSVYKRVCMACHTLSVWGAPKLGDRAAWAARVAKGRTALYFSAQNGFNQMPPRGYCQFCTDGELRAAVDYMVSKVLPPKRRPRDIVPGES